MRLTESPLPENERPTGQGNINQIHADLEALESFGAEHVLLDTYRGNPEQTKHLETDWATLELLAEQLLDLEGESLQ